jgi:hypothetical protein
MVKQTIRFLAVFIVAALLWILVKDALHSWFHPASTVVMTILEEKLGDLSPKQEKRLKTTVRRYPLEALFAAHQSGWQGIEVLHQKGPDQAQTVMALAFKADRKSIDKTVALSFIENSSGLLDTFADLDPAFGSRLLDEIKNLGASEYANMAFDPSYILIAPRLSPRYRDSFQKNQKVLTPLLTLMNPGEWDRFMARFEEAQPRIGEIISDPTLDEGYAWSFVLNQELVTQMTLRAFSEADAVRFLSLNSETVRENQGKKPTWIDDLKALKACPATAAANGAAMTLFDWACADPAIYWVSTQDPSPDRASAYSLMARYAGSELPTILRLHFSSDPRLLHAALDALHRFDNETDAKPEKRNLVSRFLNRYQNDPQFKRLLARHGAVLIPALAVGGEQDLIRIEQNPNNLYKHVDEQGKPRSTWWQYIPGGSIVAVIRDLSSGRGVTAGEWGWAAFDAVTIAAITATSIKALSSAKALKAAQPVSRALSTGTHVARQGAWAQIKMRALPVLVASGKVAKKSVGTLITIAQKHPVKALVGALAVYYAINPEALSKHSRQVGRMAAGIPTAVVSGLWDQIADRLNQSPILSLLYYPILIFFSLLVLSVILAALKHFLKPVWDMLILLLRPFRLLRRKR